MRVLVILLTIVSYAARVNAQLDTDRPAFTSTPSTVSPKNIQAEMGVSLANGDYFVDTVSYLSGPNISLRYGLTKNTELRLLLPSLGADINDQSLELNDLELGIKTRLIHQDIYQVSAIFGVYLTEQKDGWINFQAPLQLGWNAAIPMAYSLDHNHRLKSEIRLSSGSGFYNIGSYTQSLVFNKTINPMLTAQVEYVFTYQKINNLVAANAYQLYHNLNISAQYQLNNRCMVDGTLSNLMGVGSDFTPFQKNIGVSLGLSYAILQNEN